MYPEIKETLKDINNRIEEITKVKERVENELKEIKEIKK